MFGAVSEPVVSSDGRGVTAIATFPASCSIFEGHFPGMPVVPAVYQIAACRHAVEHSYPLALSGVVRCRFSRMCGPGKQYRISVSMTAAGESVEAACSLYDDAENALCSKIVLLFEKIS